jgi:hypothetical protein
MSIKAIQVVLDESKHKGSALLLLIVLANHAHDDGRWAFPSVNTMTRYTRLTRRNVQLLLRKLEESGELAPMGVHNSGTHIYRLILPGFSEGGVKFTPAKKRGAQSSARGGDPSDAGGAIPMTPEPSVNHPEPSRGLTPISKLRASVRPSGLGRH